jgi:phosphatidylserine/phosphatidylglycerophosphate/cardiolipin synthase-like enzyme
MFPTLALGLLFLSPVFAQETLPVLGSIATHTDLGTYLLAHTNGAVRPTKESFLAFKINHVKNVAVPIIPEWNPDLIHSLFETDVVKYIQNAGAEDFVSAKKKYYRSQTFNNSTQQFSRSYVYPSDWHSLNHNPIRKIDLPTEVYGQHFQPLDAKSIEQSPLVGLEVNRKLDRITGTEMTAGNKLRLLNNGQVSFKEKVRMVKQSKNFFHAVVMVQYCDESSSEIVDAMIERARAGVDVRLMTESVWTNIILKKCLAKLRNGGVKVTLGKGFFNPRTMFTVHHTKFWIRDGEEAIMGGQNMHDFENTSNGFNNHTRDKDVHVIGPAVTDMMRQYVRIWNHEQKRPDPTMTQYLNVVARMEAAERAEGNRGTELYQQWLGRPAGDIPGVCRVLVQGTKTSDTPGIITKAYIEIMNNAKYSMIINSPTFRYKETKQNAHDNSAIIRAMIEGSKRGLNIDVISNGVDGGWGEAGHQLRLFALKLRRKGKPSWAGLIEKLDKVVAVFIGRSNRKNLANAVKGSNVDVWLYFNHIHAKQMSFDHIMTSTGSFNLDQHSYKNHESTMICLDKKLADESLVSFVSDIVNATPIIQ